MKAALLLALLATADAETHALLVGVSEYQDNALVDLHAQRDLEAIRKALQTRGVASASVRVLHDATAARFRAEVTELVGRARPGDVVFLHFSGHGTQTPDDNGDEADERDEALLFTDSLVGEPDTYLRDDELAGHVEQLRRRLGPEGQVVVSIDACFSGGAYRAGHIVRGAGEATRGSTDGIDLPSSSGSGASWVMLTASSGQEWAYEQANAGAFSTALAAHLSAGGPWDTYETLITSVRTVVSRQNRDQNPSAVGDVHARVLRTGPRPSPRARVIRVSSRGEVELDAGLLHGLEVGHRVRLVHGAASTPAVVTSTRDLTATVVPADTTINLWDAVAVLPPHPHVGNHLRTVRGTGTTPVVFDIRHADSPRSCKPLAGTGPPRDVQPSGNLALSVHNPGPIPVWFLLWSVEPEDDQLFTLSSPAGESSVLLPGATWHPSSCVLASPTRGIDAYRVAVASRPFDLTPLLGGEPPTVAGQGDASDDVAIIRVDLDIR